MVEMEVLNIPGVTDGLNNDYAAQVKGALEALNRYDLVVIHVEAPDEAAHGGAIDDKMEAIQKVDGEIVSRIRKCGKDAIRVLIMPDHATPVKIQTHTDEPVPFMLWGKGFEANGAKRFTEAEAKGTGFFIDEGYNIMGRLVSKEI
jgi:2,3-bisphosphoglycerate-independent phosphoglycerate mutase